YSKEAIGNFINKYYPGSISDISDYLLEAEGAYTLGHTLMIGIVAAGKFYLMSVGEPDSEKIQTNFPTSDEKSYSQLLNTGYDILTLPTGDYEGSQFLNSPLDDGDTSLLKVHVENNNDGRKLIEATQSYSGNQWTRTVHTDGTGGSGWIVTTGSSFLNTTLTPMNSATATRMEYYTETRGYYAKHVEF
ncbi:hypothetical protein ACRE9K_27725, partial [Klebsiella pneumoniae]